MTDKRAVPTWAIVVCALTAGICGGGCNKSDEPIKYEYGYLTEMPTKSGDPVHYVFDTEWASKSGDELLKEVGYTKAPATHDDLYLLNRLGRKGWEYVIREPTSLGERVVLRRRSS